MFVAARWGFFNRDVGNHSLLAARAGPVFTLRHIRPLQFVRLPIVLLVKLPRSRIGGTGVSRLVLFRLLCIGCDCQAIPSIVHIQAG